MLLSSVNEKSYIEIYRVAENIGANILATRCLKFGPILCEDFPTVLVGKVNAIMEVESSLNEYLVSLINALKYIIASIASIADYNKWELKMSLLCLATIIVRDEIKKE